MQASHTSSTSSGQEGDAAVAVITLKEPHSNLSFNNFTEKKQGSMAEVDDGPHNLSQGTKSQVDVVPGFPVSAKQFSTVIQDNKTDFMLCSYDDCIFVLATQLGKMGTLLHARKEEGYGAQITFSVNVLMGKHDEPILQACARQLIEHISGMGSSRPLLLSLGLKDHSMGTLKGIIEAVCDNKVW